MKENKKTRRNSFLIVNFMMIFFYILAYFHGIFSPLSSWGGGVKEQLGGHLVATQDQPTTLG